VKKKSTIIIFLNFLAIYYASQSICHLNRFSFPALLKKQIQLITHFIKKEDMNAMQWKENVIFFSANCQG
jgi:hypothetical protein